MDSSGMLHGLRMVVPERVNMLDLAEVAVGNLHNKEVEGILLAAEAVGTRRHLDLVRHRFRPLLVHHHLHHSLGNHSIVFYTSVDICSKVEDVDVDAYM